MVADIDKMTASSTEFYILVDVTDGRRDFYVVPGDDLRRGMRARHQQFLTAAGGVRPRNPGSRHTAIQPSHVQGWQDAWAVLRSHAEPAAGKAEQ